tara:strand:+ start:182 stop:421 length:240 start_codon:yes stop_codon:yes gene_type:complete
MIESVKNVARLLMLKLGSFIMTSCIVKIVALKIMGSRVMKILNVILLAAIIFLLGLDEWLEYYIELAIYKYKVWSLYYG